jgi:octaprenyl-diphosphate synthase
MDTDRTHKEYISKPPLEKLKIICDSELNQVNSILINQVKGTLPFITKLSEHLILSGGKRLRPLLTISSANMFNYKGNKHISLSACVEMIHTATLLHDDVVDDSKKRRNKITANSLWGNSASILVGDFLFSKSFVLMVNNGSKEVLRTLSQSSLEIAEGEVLQLTQLKHPTKSIEIYLNIIKRKTACLFAASCKVGSLIGRSSKITTSSLEKYGYYLGLAFQITDDLLDYNSCEKKLGKIIGDDFREGKITLPSILAFKKSDNEEKKFWKRTLGEKKQEKGDLNKAISIINKYNCNRESLDMAEKYVSLAQKSLILLPSSKEKKSLKEIASYCIRRSQ